MTRESRLTIHEQQRRPCRENRPISTICQSRRVEKLGGFFISEIHQTPEGLGSTYKGGRRESGSINNFYQSAGWNGALVPNVASL